MGATAITGFGLSARRLPLSSGRLFGPSLLVADHLPEVGGHSFGAHGLVVDDDLHLASLHQRLARAGVGGQVLVSGVRCQ